MLFSQELFMTHNMWLNIFNKKRRISEIIQYIIQFFINDTSSKEQKISEQNMDDFLATILNQVAGLESIIIFDLTNGWPLYHDNKDPEMHQILFGDNDIGVALKDFTNLNQVKEALNSFGKSTQFGSLEYSLFKLKDAHLMVFFHDLPDTSVAICFLAAPDKPNKKNMSIGTLVFEGKQYIQKIKDKLEHDSDF